MNPTRDHGLRRLVVGAAALSLAVLATSERALATPRIITSTFLGGAGHETVRGVRFASDGTLVASIASFDRMVTIDNGMERPRFTWASSRVVRLDRDARKLLWDKAAPEEIVAVHLSGKDDVYLLGKSKVHKLRLADGAVVAASEAFSPSPVDFSVTPAGEVAVLSGGKVVRLGADLAKAREFNHNIQTPFAILTDREGGTFVSGDYNPGTGCEPYRVPVLRHFSPAGERDWRFYDYPGQLARLEGAGSRESDSSIRGLATDPRGRLWFLGWSDGLNTMLSQKVWNPKEKNPFIETACFSGVCPFPRGARTYMMVGRLLDTYDEVGRATWWQAANQRPTTNGGAVPPEGFTTWLEKYPLCGCRPHPYATTTSNRIEGLGFSGSEVVIWGGSDKYAPASPDAWFGRLVENGSMYVGILDQDLGRGRFGATIPGTTSPVHDGSGDVRGGRLVLAGGAVNGYPTRGEPHQAAFGGGDSDGFLLLACLEESGTCDGAMPALPMPAAKPAIKPQPPLPELSRCMRGPPLVPAKIVSGTLPDFGIDYSQAPRASDGGMPASDAVDAGIGGPADAAAAVKDAAAADRASTTQPDAGTGGGGAPTRDARPAPDDPEPEDDDPPRMQSKAAGCALAPGGGDGRLLFLPVALVLLVHATRTRRRSQAK